MHILITGGCGYKGTKLVSLLLAEGHRVSVYDKQWFGNHLENNSNLQVFNIDVRNLENIELKDVDSVIHLASVANDPCSDLSPKLAWEVSTLATMKLVEKSVKSGVSQFIYASSGSVYGIKDEEQVTEDLDLVPISDYNKGKMVAERVLLSYSEQIRIAIVRPATVCGFSPRMRLDVAVNLLTMQALEHGEITVLGGRQIRPNIHIDDICNLYLFLLERPDLTGVFNAGFENISIMDIANKIRQKLNVQVVTKASNDPRSYRLNSDKILNAGFLPTKNVDNAIDELITLFRNGELINKDEYHNLKWMIENNIN